MFKTSIVGLLLVISASVACRRGDSAEGSGEKSAPAPLRIPPGQLVARALGEIDGLKHANSVEALQCNYKRGFRWFELDLAATLDGDLVGFRKGDEKRAGLADRIGNLPTAELKQAKYAGKFAIASFSTLLAEADRLGEVVFVLDPDSWTPKMEQAISRELGYGPRHPTRFVLQAFSEKDLDKVAQLSRELGAGLIWNLRDTSANDQRIEELAKKFQVLAVAATEKRFTPWLAERLHAAGTPILVQTVNDHRDILSFTRAGADGFFTDSYVPFGTLVADRSSGMSCGEAKPTAEQLQPWTRRGIMHPGDYKLEACAKRVTGAVQLDGCSSRPALTSKPLPVPPGQAVHVQIDAQAGKAAANLWLELGHGGRGKPLRPRDTFALKPNERRTFQVDLPLEKGSAGMVARVGLGAKTEQASIHRLKVFHGDAPPEEAGAVVDADAGDGD
jgi:glycerophosphoryl diester phosphodiesterase